MRRVPAIFILAFILLKPALGQELSGIGVEIPMSIINTKIDLPRLLTGTIPKVEGGTKYGIGIGITYDNSYNLNLRGGLHMWEVPFKPTVNAISNNDDDYIVEDGILSYYGIYLRAEYGVKFFFIGGGFDFSFANNYKTDREYYENNILIGTEKGLTESVLTDKFNNIFNIVINTGFKIPIENRYIIKPYVSLGTSFSSIYPTDRVTDIVDTPYLRVYYDEPQKVDLQYISILGYGISLEYKL